MKNVKMIPLDVHSDSYGKLTPIEGRESIPFDIQRVYYIHEVDQDVRRGFHSHKNLEQVLICVHGSVKILLKTPDEEKTVVLDNPSQGLYIGPDIWREMYDFSCGAVLLVLASEHYDVSDYIRDYQQYDAYYQKKKRGN